MLLHTEEYCPNMNGGGGGCNPRAPVHRFPTSQTCGFDGWRSIVHLTQSSMSSFSSLLINRWTACAAFRKCTSAVNIAALFVFLSWNHRIKSSIWTEFCFSSRWHSPSWTPSVKYVPTRPWQVFNTHGNGSDCWKCVCSSAPDGQRCDGRASRHHTQLVPQQASRQPFIRTGSTHGRCTALFPSQPWFKYRTANSLAVPPVVLNVWRSRRSNNCSSNSSWTSPRCVWLGYVCDSNKTSTAE